MTHSQRILRFNFWMTNLFLVIIGMFFLTTRLHAPVGVTLGLVIFNSVMLYFQLWVITHRFGVKKIQGLYFVDDEREQAIALRVHNACMTTLIYSIYGLIIVVFLLMADWGLTIQTFGDIILTLLLLVLFSSNCQYYYLWRKYDHA